MTDYHNTLVKSISHAAYTMPDVRFRAKGYSGIDSDKRIKRCLSCPYDECIDCYDNPEAVYKQIRLMGEQGKTIAQISNKIGISKRSVHYLISRYSSASSNMNNKGDRRIMRVNNSITPQNTLRQRTVAQPAQTKQDLFALAIKSANAKEMIAASLPEKDRAAFIAEIITAVKTTPKLQQCDPESVLAAGLRGRSQNLRLGFHYYIIPYGRLASYQIGYKGLLNLAIASNFYETIVVHAIYANEEISVDPVTGAYTMNTGIRVVGDESNGEPIGYSCGFLLKNGFKYSDFMTVKQILKHADKHSSAFSLETYNKLKNGQFSADEAEKLASGSPWYDIKGDGFERMCRKTIILRVMNSGFAPITNAMSEAMAVPDEGVVFGTHVATPQAASDPLIIDAKPVEEVHEKAETPSDTREAPLAQDKPEGKETPTEPQKVSERPRKMPRAVSRVEPKQETSAETAQTSVFEQ